ncbi:MAG: biotin--[acetyl-CoA-carboxylase] ligase [Acidimicrobiales bacterium]|nr:biotin--[acetyl-CoA-carboxylase] ligase [Acidimicrobiales bacterium]
MATTGSTNQDLLDRLAEGDATTTGVLADLQTEGRGRLGRKWLSEHDHAGPQAMTGSLLLLWDDEPGLPLVPFAAGLATVDVVRSELGDVLVGMGWPNDVITWRDGRWRKLAGILVETAPLGTSSTRGVVVGVGLNLRPLAGADDSVVDRAVSLQELADGHDPESSNVDLFLKLEERLSVWIDALQADPVQFMARYREICRTIGQPVRVRAGGQVIEGVAEGVADGGELLIAGEAQVRSVSVGDVEPL